MIFQVWLCYRSSSYSIHSWIINLHKMKGKIRQRISIKRKFYNANNMCDWVNMKSSQQTNVSAKEKTVFDVIIRLSRRVCLGSKNYFAVLLQLNSVLFRISVHQMFPWIYAINNAIKYFSTILLDSLFINIRKAKRVYRDTSHKAPLWVFERDDLNPSFLGEQRVTEISC